MEQGRMGCLVELHEKEIYKGEIPMSNFVHAVSYFDPGEEFVLPTSGTYTCEYFRPHPYPHHETKFYIIHCHKDDLPLLNLGKRWNIMSPIDPVHSLSQSSREFERNFDIYENLFWD